MLYKESFAKLLDMQSNAINRAMYIFGNSIPSKMKIFPEGVTEVLYSEYFSSINKAVKDKRYADYVPETVADENVIRVIKTADLDIWQEIQNARNSIDVQNAKQITEADYRKAGNTILMEVNFELAEQEEMTSVFFLSVYRNVPEWYTNSVRFFSYAKVGAKNKKAGQSELIRMESDILAIPPTVDAVIFGEHCYILDEANFRRIFKYDRVVARIVTRNSDDLKKLQFIENGKSFCDRVLASSRLVKEMAKALNSGRVKRIQSYTPQHICQQINKYDAVKEIIRFTNDYKIIVDEQSCSTVVGILSGRINLDLITDEVNGLVEDEP